MPGRTDIDPHSITDGKISNQAKISHSKIAPAVEGQLLVAQSNGKFAAKSLSGDVTIKADGSATSTASVVVSGESTVVQGPAGPAGPAGPIGPQGNQGESGPAGGDATVTTSAVDTAGAVMHTDFGSDGFIKRNGLGTYAIDSNSYEQSFSKNTAFNKNFGTAAGDVCQGNDSRLSDARTPSSHTHDLSDVTDSGGAAALDIGTTAGTVCAGDDSRLTDSRAPTSHTHDDRYYTETETDTLLATKSGTGHTHSDATGSAAGFMPCADKTKLDGIEVNATNTVAWEEDQGSTNIHSGNYINTTYTSSDFDHDALTNFEANEHIDWTAASAGTVHASNYTDTTYSNATTSASGLMSGTDKTKLDGVESGAEVNILSDWNASSGDAVISNKPTLGDSASKDVGASSDKVAAGDHTHDGRYFQETEFLNASAGAGDAGKPVKLDAEGHIDTTMINSADVSYVDLDDIPSTFAPSAHNHTLSDVTDSGTAAPLDVPASGNATTGQVVKGNDTTLSDARTPSAHNHAATDITSGTLDTARLDVGASSGKVAAGDHTHSQYSTAHIDDSSALTSDVWSASKIISYLATFYATLANGFSGHKFTLEFVWGTDETGLVFSGSGASEFGTLTHSLGTKDIVVSVRAVEDDDGTNNINYQEDELADVGYDPFMIVANGTNTCKILQMDDANVAGTWAITVIG